jgi:hypothetical protein
MQPAYELLLAKKKKRKKKDNLNLYNPLSQAKRSSPFCLILRDL